LIQASRTGQGGELAVDHVGGDEVMGYGAGARNFEAPVLCQTLLQAVEVVLRIAIAQFRSKHRQCRKIRILRCRKRLQYRCARPQVIETAAQRKDRKLEAVIADALPEIVEGTVVKDAAAGAEDRATVARKIQPGADAVRDAAAAGRVELADSGNEC